MTHSLNTPVCRLIARALMACTLLGIATSEEVTDDDIVVFGNEGGVGLAVGVVAREQVREAWLVWPLRPLPVPPPPICTRRNWPTNWLCQCSNRS